MIHEILVLGSAIVLICVYAIVLGGLFALHLHEMRLRAEPIVNEADYDADEFG